MPTQEQVEAGRRIAKRTNASSVSIRFVLIGACLGWLSRKALRPLLLPFGKAFPIQQFHTYASVDPANDLLMMKHGRLSKIEERVPEGQVPLLKGLETIFFDDDGNMFSANEDGNLIMLSDFESDPENPKFLSAKTTLVKNLGNGRPLGARFWGETLYLADPVQGLLRVKNVWDPHSKTEIVATTATQDGKSTPINFADDVVVAPKTGMVYFTDATAIPAHKKRNQQQWDIMYPSKIEAVRGPTGRILRYDPSTEEVTVVATDLFFANGISISEDESYIVFAESFRSRATKLYVQGEKSGTLEYLIDGYPSPAWFDGVDCATSTTAEKQYCYVISPTYIVPVAKLYYMMPPLVNQIFRTFLLMIPPELAPKMKPYTSIEIVDPETKEYVGIIQDPKGTDISSGNGITVHDNKLYLASLHRDFVGVYDLNGL